MTKLFTEEPLTWNHQNFLDEVTHHQEILYVVYVLKEKLERLTFTQAQPMQVYEEITFSIINDKLYAFGETLVKGRNQLNHLSLFVLPASDLHTHFLVLDEGDFIIDHEDVHRAIQVKDVSTIVIDNQDLNQPNLFIKPTGEFVYFNGQKITESLGAAFQVGDTVLTPDLFLERRAAQWKVTVFSEEVKFNHHYFLEQHRILEKPQDFPDYRRSPRLTMEVPEEKFQYEKIAEPEQAPKGGLAKMILPPIGMFAVGGLTTVLSGRSPIMMMAMGLASVMTTVFTITQYQTEKKDRLKRESFRESDYQLYVAKTTSSIGKVHTQEKKIRHFQQPSPQQLLELLSKYDARIYERMVNNKDFLRVSLGINTQPSSLKVESGYTSREEDEWAVHIKNLVNQFSRQPDVPLAIDLKTQTLGLVGNYPQLKEMVANLYLQLAFFHSYRDVNFITLVPEKSYQKDWATWRFLPHIKIQSINTRGIIHNAKSRDMVLSSFYQILNGRKQELAASGREKPTFLPHFVFTVFDDSYLAGHGINEFLAEDLSELGVTVIWAKEDKKLLPETVTSLIEVKNQKAGVLVQNNGVHLDSVFQPYPPITEAINFETTLRQLSGLNHLEVEKNAIPEKLSLLEQYLVETVEELDIKERWKQANPSKSIASMIGWKGKKEFAYWDLHEQIHGPHAIVGGTSGSGKSEFLTTFLMGLAINFSPEDIGMLIIDWKGGGIANTLSELPHFMGAITNLDGAGTTRALASINAELKKRQREFAKYGVNNISGYTKLYQERLTPRVGIKYPTKPLPHLMLVSDEFAELKENAPEFLDELTSVARIGRSLGVHLILATQKPDGVVNDQIDANAKSKVALKMSDEQNSRALIKTGDAAHITNAGRGYLRVGESEVYELFQSGYGGVDYNPHGKTEEQIDERIFKINPSGQWELLYDPQEEKVEQKIVAEDFPTQLEAVIEEIGRVFETSTYVQPDRPWLPNLGEMLVSVQPEQKAERNLSIPLGLLDIPSLQAQKVYNYNLEETSHTVIFSSPGFGKSTTLQTIVMNLARQNTPEQVQFNLLDFGTNGLLPLKDLPHVADIVTLEENEKLQKMLGRLSENLAQRKALFKKEGVANLAQYQSKIGQQLPILVSVLDSYDGLTPQEPKKEAIDYLLLQLIREGASLGMYLVMTSGRVGAIRMNMMANIQTKMAFYLNDESELVSIMGRNRLAQADIVGRGQIMQEAPTAIQFYLPTTGKNAMEILENMSDEIEKLNHDWKGSRPTPIPMAPEKLTNEVFDEHDEVKKWRKEQKLPLGMSYQTTNILGFIPKVHPYFLFASMDDEQNYVFQQIFLQQLSKIQTDVLVVDFIESFEEILNEQKLSENISLITDKNEAKAITKGMIDYVQLVKKKETGKPMLLVISDLQDFTKQTGISARDFIVLLKNTYKAGLDILIFSPHEYIAKSFDEVPKAIRQLKFAGLIGARIYDSPLLKGNGVSSEQELTLYDAYFVVKGGASFDKLKLPQTVKGEENE